MYMGYGDEFLDRGSEAQTRRAFYTLLQCKEVIGKESAGLSCSPLCQRKQAVGSDWATVLWSTLRQRNQGTSMHSVKVLQRTLNR